MASTRNGLITAVIFDLGGVLLDWNPRYLYRKMFEDEQAMEHFLRDVCTMDWHEANDRGVPFEVTCAQLAAEHPEHAEQIWAWGTRTEEMVGGSIEGTVQILRELIAAGSVRVFALTNMEAHTYPVRLERYDFMGWFEGTVVSSQEGVVKPDRRIFELLLERYGLDAASTLMIDDSERNIAAARALGMPAVLFRSPEALRSELEAAGVLAPEGGATASG
ncbi:MAG TPA: HAD family phosphatase [Solirubrobacteraceae bacterium]|nr:HAD family phosphatase [Solirubrobacteraceae bacterium]